MIPIIKNHGRLTECMTRFPGDLIYQTFCKRCDQCVLWKTKKLELDKDVKKNNWWLNERAKIMEVIEDNEGCDEN